MSAEAIDVIPNAPATARGRPCDDCRHKLRCAREPKLGCHALILFMRHPGTPARWSRAPRQPTRELYEIAMRPPPKVQTPRVFRPPIEQQPE